MGMDLTGIINCNEYYTNHYFSSIFEENASGTIVAWKQKAKEEGTITPWSKFRDSGRQYYRVRDRYIHLRSEVQSEVLVKEMADIYLASLGYSNTVSEEIEVADGVSVPLYLEVSKKNGEPLLWALLCRNQERDDDIMQGISFNQQGIDEEDKTDRSEVPRLSNDEILSKIFFAREEAPRWVILIGINQIALIDRNKWNEKRYLKFDLDDIFSRHEETTFQAMTVLLHKESLCPNEGISLLDKLDENSHKHSSGVSDALKYALRECIELLGNEVIYDMKNRQQIDFDENPIDASKLTIECLRYMYRILFMLFIEARPELGYAPMKSQVYVQGYSLEGLRDITEKIRIEENEEVGEGYYLHETISKLFEMIYEGYPGDAELYAEVSSMESLHDMFVIEPLKAHIFDPEYTSHITNAKLRNCVMLQIIDLMSISRSNGSKERKGRISYSALGINQMGAVYEALLSYRGFFAEEILFEVKRARDTFNELDVGYFVPESELDNYSEDERVRYDKGEKKNQLRVYEKGTFIYRLAGREREKSASYYTPEVLTKCLVKYALKELLEGKTADEILHLTVCEPAMGSAAFLNEVINQLSEEYLNKKQEELGEIIPFDERFQELQRVKMFIADRNVYGVDLNPVAVELAEVSLWLNTIYKGAYVPWFGTQIVCGNSLIGARRQVYKTSKLEKGKWYEEAPERIMPKEKRGARSQVYHFLIGDSGMSNYTDKVIKGLEEENIKRIKDWNKKFIVKYSEDDIKTLLRLSETIDDLWKRQIELRQSVEEAVADALSLYGHTEIDNSSHTTIRQKDKIYSQLYKSEKMNNAGPYARLKCAMDYWCALWFWPIDMAELLPSRQEFLFDMALILEGGISSVGTSPGQLLFKFDDNNEGRIVAENEIGQKIYAQYSDLAMVDLAALRERNERLELANTIAKQHKFLHWELEFADLFDEKGGFDLIIGNPPWLKTTWTEQDTLSDVNPLFAVKNLTATQTTHLRNDELVSDNTKSRYLEDYIEATGIQNFLNAKQNYAELKGSQTNLFKCFLPQSWMYGSFNGVAAFIHPDGVFDDPNGGELRKKLYPRLRKHFQFINEKKLFSEVDHHMVFSLNVYCNQISDKFQMIANLFDTNTIDECYDNSITAVLPGIKDEEGRWNIKGHPGRIVNVGKSELQLFAKLFDGSHEWKMARLPAIHAHKLIDVLKMFAKCDLTLKQIEEDVYLTEMWHETNSQLNGTIMRNVHIPESKIDTIYSGPHIGVSNPLFKASRRVCKLNSDYDNIDLTSIDSLYLQRCNYSPVCSNEEYTLRKPMTNWDTRSHSNYSIFARKMLNLSGERTLISSIVPGGITHINGILGIDFRKIDDMLLAATYFSAIPYDFFIRTLGKSNLYTDNAGKLPLIFSKYNKALMIRGLLLNTLNIYYKELWEDMFDSIFKEDGWGKKDVRLLNSKFELLSNEWEWNTPVRTDYARRELLLEIDVLTAMALDMTLEQLKMIYHIQFPVLQSYESDTWYDQNGRIVFTNNRSLTGVGYSRPEWESIKDAREGTFTRVIEDDTMPGGPIERTIEYVAPFDRCDREKDYEEVWKHFEERFS